MIVIFANTDKEAKSLLNIEKLKERRSGEEIMNMRFLLLSAQKHEETRNELKDCFNDQISVVQTSHKTLTDSYLRQLRRNVIKHVNSVGKGTKSLQQIGEDIQRLNDQCRIHADIHNEELREPKKKADKIFSLLNDLKVA